MVYMQKATATKTKQRQLRDQHVLSGRLKESSPTHFVAYLKIECPVVKGFSSFWSEILKLLTQSEV